MSAIQKSPNALPLSMVLRNALAKSGGEWQLIKRADTGNPADYDQIQIGAVEVRRYERRVVTLYGGHMTDYPGEIAFTSLYKKIANLAAKTPKPEQIDSYERLRAIEPFTVVQAALELEIMPKQARGVIARAVKSGKLMMFPVEAGPARWCVVGKESEPPKPAPVSMALVPAGFWRYSFAAPVTEHAPDRMSDDPNTPAPVLLRLQPCPF